jgi:hypothetical protein
VFDLKAEFASEWAAAAQTKSMPLGKLSQRLPYFASRTPDKVKATGVRIGLLMKNGNSDSASVTAKIPPIPPAVSNDQEVKSNAWVAIAPQSMDGWVLWFSPGTADIDKCWLVVAYSLEVV